MLAYDLLNKYRQTSPISDCQILDDCLATIPCLGRLQTLNRSETLEIIHPVQGRGQGGKNYALSSGTTSILRAFSLMIENSWGRRQKTEQNNSRRVAHAKGNTASLLGAHATSNYYAQAFRLLSRGFLIRGETHSPYSPYKGETCPCDVYILA